MRYHYSKRRNFRRLAVGGTTYSTLLLTRSLLPEKHTIIFTDIDFLVVHTEAR
jgi:hypothetical protein